MTEAKVRQELEKAEAAQRKAGRAPPLHKTGPSEFIRLGLELEETQYVEAILRYDGGANASIGESYKPWPRCRTTCPLTFKIPL